MSTNIHLFNVEECKGLINSEVAGIKAEPFYMITIDGTPAGNPLSAKEYPNILKWLRSVHLDDDNKMY